jgi:hypothetical protein
MKLDLNYVDGAGHESQKACSAGTRVHVLEELKRWVHDPAREDSRVRFLLGTAGTGKSAIAHSIALHFGQPGRGRRLGSFFAFNRSHQVDRHPHSILRTIAVDLADWNPSFKAALARAVEEDGSLARTNDIRTQWNNLIVGPTKQVVLVGPVLIVIDAFDESSDADSPSRRLLLNTLLDGAKDLPSNLRILVTSRPENDVVAALRNIRPSFPQSHSFVDSSDLDAYNDKYPSETDSDIMLYLREQLADLSPDDPLDERQFTHLVEKCERLFQWAFTACSFIRGLRGLTAKEAFNRLISSLSTDGKSSLDTLYAQILRLTFPSNDEHLMARFRSVMAQVLSAAQPLSIDALDDIRRLGTNVTSSEVASLVQNMGALLSGVSSSASPIRPLHTSFRDFLTTSSRSEEWHVGLREGHDIMSLGSVRVMNRSLHFNICRVETSYKRNAELPSIAIKHVPESVRYAARYWTNHFSSNSHTSAVGDSLRAETSGFIRQKLLAWLELLSVLRYIHLAVQSLSSARALFTVNIIYMPPQKDIF